MTVQSMEFDHRSVQRETFVGKHRLSKADASGILVDHLSVLEQLHVYRV